MTQQRPHLKKNQKTKTTLFNQFSPWVKDLFSDQNQDLTVGQPQEPHPESYLVLYL